MELSAVLITYNAQKYLSLVLESLEEVADEVVIVDSGSTDKTKEIALSFSKVRWYEQPFMGYGKQKNYANSLAQGEYILSVDADEVLSPALRTSICREKGHWRAEAYQFLRVAVYCGQFIRAGDWYPDWKIRLFRRVIARWSEDPVHERIILPPRTRVESLEGELWHYAYETPEENLFRGSRYAWLYARHMHLQNWKPRWVPALVRAGARFVKSILLRGGWRLGWRGISIAFIGAIVYILREIYLAYLHEQHHSNPLPPSTDP
ncbi:MAG: glycosyltransferase family 2 protein [Bacteroidia bacterium]|nr:glycosyltransferase family 2 protein [Bacteroidia bacterium]MDW8015526.1 glycosyltransferase family 2 protein [Bacteroidia bacterium]